MSNYFTQTSNTPSLANLAGVLKENIFSTLNCVKIGYIDSFNYETGVSRVIIYNKRVVAVTQEGEPILQDYPPLYAKTLFLGGKTNSITWDIQQGDECIIFFADREIESPWISGQVSNLKYKRKHNFTDAICLTGFRTLPNTIPTNENLNIKSENGIINIEGNTVINGDLTINGNLIVTGDATIGGISFLQHVHSNGNQGEDTGVPKQ